VVNNEMPKSFNTSRDKDTVQDDCICGQKDDRQKKAVVIIGGGISGLTCAFRLQQSDCFKNGDMTITLLEASARLGGIIETLEIDDCFVESGPDSFITNKPYMLDLAARLDLSDEIIGTQEKGRGAMIVSNGRLLKLPDGFTLIAPTKILPFLESPVMSWSGKLRVMMEPFLPVRSLRRLSSSSACSSSSSSSSSSSNYAAAGDDESLADFVRRRFGKEMLERIAQPMVGGIYVGDAEKLSAAMTAERFVALEQSSGSVIGGLIKNASTADSAAGGVRYALFCSFKKGMGELVQKLSEKLSQINIRLLSPVRLVTRQEDGSWLVTTSNEKVGGKEEQLEAHQLVIALPAKESGRLLQDSAPDLAQHLGLIEAASSAVVNFIFKRDDFLAPAESFGLVVPEIEMKKLGLSIIALAFASNKFKGRAPQDKMVIRAFLGGMKGLSVLEKNDQELTALALADIAQLIGLKVGAAPSYTRVHRWPGAMPQYFVGHKNLLTKIDAALAKYPGLSLAGASYRGVGLPECVNGGNLCAEKIVQEFTERQLVV